jgi:CSLREA domain-containing protein
MSDTTLSLLITVAFFAFLVLWAVFCNACHKRAQQRASRSTGRRVGPRDVTRVLIMVALALPWLLAAERPAAAADFHVNSVADKVDATPGDGICSTGSLLPDGVTPECTLRAAIDEVNALSAANPSLLYTVSVMAGTYNLTTNETCKPLSVSTAVLCISANVTLNGADAATTIVDHALVDRDFFVSSGATAAINNMTIQNGAQYGGTYDGGGGGVNNQGVLTLSNDIFLNNTSQVEEGGGIYNGGTLIVEGSTFIGNSGCGIAADYAITSIDDSYFTKNTAYYGGAAISIYEGSLSISNSTITGNTVSTNGIVSLYGTGATVTNSTISNNTIGNAGAVATDGVGSSLTLNNVTIAGNTAGNSVGGLLASTVTMSNTILAGNTGYDCAVDALTDLGHNLVQVPDLGVCNITSPTTLTGMDAKLGAVAISGGSIPTQEPLAGSPAIGAGSKATPGSGAGACTALDERGFVRGVGGVCTIGAVEPLGSFQIGDILPNVGSPGGTAGVVVHGNGFLAGSTLALRDGGQAIPLLEVTVAPDTHSIAGLLDLSKAAAGSYDVVVTTPSGVTQTLSGAYTVVKANAPEVYSYVLGPGAARPDRPSYYTVVYGNRGNADAYLVPLTLGLPGNYAGLILSPVLPPPPATGQAITDWTNVPVEVGPYSTTGTTNVPLLVPVIPAGSQGVLRFSLTPPAGSGHGDTFTFSASLGDPYAITPGGAVDPTVLSELVAGAQTYAQTNLGVTLTAGALAQMSTYGASQLQQVEAMGETALVSSAQGRPIFFDTAQLSIDVASYGAKLVGGTSETRRAGLRPDGGGGETNPGSQECSGVPMTPGASCGDKPIPAPTPSNPPPPGYITRDDCLALPGHHISQYGSTCVPNDPHGCAIIANPVFADSVNCGYFPIEESLDPNEKDGPLGIGTQHYSVAGDAFEYQVEFENSASASAAAQTVSVTDPLDTSQYDLSTFQLGPISFGPYVVTPPPGLTSFASALDLRPTENVIVAVSANLDKSTGIATWNFTSLDPATMQLTPDPTAGFLPPDTTPPAGIGHVAFSVQPLASVASGAMICNTASVVFDTNAAISTAPFCNSKDTTAPVSSVQPLTATQSSPTFTVSWTGTDAGVGVGTYTIYVSVDGGAFTAWVTGTQATSASYTGSASHSYGFYSIATDLLGNTEAPKSQAEANTSVGAAQTITFGPLPNTTYPQKPIALTARASSGLPVTYTVTGPATVSGSSLTLTGTGTVQVTATQAGNATYAAAPPISQSFTVTAGTRAAPPALTPNGGTFPTARSVVISDATPNATIYYTTDGSMPTTSSTQYTGPVMVSKSETLAAMAVSGNGMVSLVTSASFMIDPYAAPIAFTPTPGTYPTARTVTITDKTAGSTIYYTTDGTTPTTSSAKYTGPITVSATETIQAIAVAAGYATASAEATYIIK